MATPHRRSARIASASLGRSTDSPAPRLGSVFEADEATMAESMTQPLDAILSSPAPHAPSTPAAATPVKVPASEMHPSRFQMTTAPPSSGLKLGFVDIEKSQGVAATHATPSKTRVPSSDFTFRTPRPAYSGDLGPEARRMMEDLREEAAKIKAKLAEEREEERAKANDSRLIARAKGKVGRFSDAHMAEFKKMDSIANHPSAFRADPARITPIKPGVKRSQAAADLEDPESAKLKQSVSRSIRKVPSKLSNDEADSPTKRIRQRIEDDAASVRPVSRDGSSIPRPKSSHMDSPRAAVPRSQPQSNLMTPTKATLARLQASKTPTVTLVKSASKTELNASNQTPAKSLARSPSKASLTSATKPACKPDAGSLVRTPSKSSLSSILKSPSKTGIPFMKSATTSKLPAPASVPTHVQTPGRFDKVKSILKRHVSASSKPPKTGTTYSATSPSKIHGRQHFIDRPLPPVPLATPNGKFGFTLVSERRVNFAEDTKGSASEQNSPSPVKSSMPRFIGFSKSTSSSSPARPEARRLFETKKDKEDGEVTYPDLSAYEAPKEEVVSVDQSSAKRQILQPLPPSVPGTFTFRSDHTIQFDAPPVGFGGSMGQSSVRQVRESSLMPTAHMPGAFPRSFIASPNKENADPQRQKLPLPPVPHGLSNKKRHRAGSEDEEDIDEGAKRGAKKLRKNPKLEDHAVFAPTVVSSPSPVKSPARKQAVTPGSTHKKRSGMSLSRLNLLAQPKLRK